jgi:KUP system potassium uptake protein
VATHGSNSSGRTAGAALTLGALGVVFGDIGTSPLYAMHEVFLGAHTIRPDADRIYGVLSLIFWSLTIIVTIKYVLFIMRADNDGEGGIMALISLIRRSGIGRARTGLALMLLGAFGAALFYGDGIITPAISVLSAVEGLTVAAPSLDNLVEPIALAVIVVLFSFQRVGTGRVGGFFGPMMLLWFATLATLGVAEMVQRPGVLRSLSPSYAVSFFVNEPGTAFLALGSVVLAVTGAEALYADMGHFGRPAITRAWLLLALPALLLNYMGQGALLIGDPGAADNPFYRLAPGWGQVPLVIIATTATVIASQAVISGAFSVTRQAIQLGFLPRLTIRHTSASEMGQIYVPLVNWALFAAIVALVVGFRSSSNLASAYGIAVTGTLAIDTILAFVVVRVVWKRPLWVALAGAAAFLTVDLLFFSANVTKILHGGWVPIVVAAIVFTLLATWRRGREIVLGRIAAMDVSTGDFLQRVAVDPPTRVPGTAVYLTAISDGLPRPLVHNLEHNHVMHENVILYTSLTRQVPRVPLEKQLTITEVGDGIVRVVAGHGFMDKPNVPAELAMARTRGVPVDPETTSYFLSDVTLSPTGPGRMAGWRKRLFALMSRNSMNAGKYLQVPSDRAIAIGTQLEF